jgi:hypothetical protein
MNDVKIANTRAAIALVTALQGDQRESDHPESWEFPARTMLGLVDELGAGADEREGLIRLVIGMANLSGHLLMSLSSVTGVSEAESLRRVAVSYL